MLSISEHGKHKTAHFCSDKFAKGFTQQGREIKVLLFFFSSFPYI